MANSAVPRFKVVLVGDYGVGKSTLFQRFVDGDHHHHRLHGDASSLSRDRECEPVKNGGSSVYRNGNGVLAGVKKRTVLNGSDITRRTLRSASLGNALDIYYRQFETETDRTVELELWDTAGLERFGTLSANYYSGAVAVIVCYSLVDPLTRASATQHILDAIEHASRSPSSTWVCPLLFVCGTKSDLRPPSVDARSTVADDSDPRRLKNEFDSVVLGSFAVSCQMVHEVEDMFIEIARLVSDRWRNKSERDLSTRFRLGSYDGANGKPSSTSGGCGCG